VTASAYDVLIVGGGPSGAVCAAHCAAGGLKTLALERAVFPRHKVCGDCLNPAVWPIFRRLDLVDRVLALPHSRLTAVDFIGADGSRINVPLPKSREDEADLRIEIAVARSHLDHLLLERARECGAVVLHSGPVTRIAANDTPIRWEVEAGGEIFSAKWLIAADGRNSTVARLRDLLPPQRRNRVGLQIHTPLPPDLAGRVVMRFLPCGYAGLADVGQGRANLCLVARPENLNAIRAWAQQHFALIDPDWSSVTPLDRAPIWPSGEKLLLVGDAARVVEPFTGEGIYYAMASGELAAKLLLSGQTASYPKAHRDLYRGRLWINLLAKQACLQPRFAASILGLARMFPPLLRLLTRKIVGG